MHTHHAVNTCVPLLCAEPPSACTNVQVTERTDTSLTVSWSRPQITGGRTDLFYRVFHSDPDDISQLIMVEDNLMTNNPTVMYEVTELRPFTSYIIRVTTHSGVSDEDSANDHLRQCEVSDTTMEGSEWGPAGGGGG